MIGRVHGSERTTAGAKAACSVRLGSVVLGSVVLGSVVLGSVVLAACSTGDAANRNRRISGVYVAVLDAALDAEPTPSADSDDDDEDEDEASSTTTSGASRSGTSSSTASTSSPVASSSTTSTSASSGSSGDSGGNNEGGSGKQGRKADKKDLPLVFVSPLEEGRPFPLEVQAAVIERLGARAMIRFVDTQQQAVDTKLDDRPTLDGGVLLRLGPVPPSGDHIQVAAERYEHLDDWSTMRFGVQSQDSGWSAALVDRRPRPAES